MPVSRRGHVPQWRGRHTSGPGAGPGVAVVGALSGPAFLIDWLLLRSVRTGHSLTPSPSAVGTAFLGAADAEQVSTCSLEGSREAACLQTALTFPESGRAAPAGAQLFPRWPCQEWAQGRLFAIHGGSHGCFFVFLCWVVPPQVLLKAFVANLKSGSPTVRRTAAGAAVSVCQHSRRTRYFYSWLLSVLLGGCRLLAVLPAPPLPVGVSGVWGRPGRGSRALGQLAGPWAGPGL